MFIIDLLFPEKCVFCMKRCENEICDDCLSGLPWVYEQQGDCLSPLLYRAKVREALHRMKFRSSARTSATLGKLMAKCFFDSGIELPELVTWVPSSLLRKRKRGFDQSYLLAKALANELKLPVKRLLRKKKHTPSQSVMAGDRERLANVRGAFAAFGNERGKKLLLVDDVKTTGATLQECKELLIKAGSGNITVIVAAKK